MLSSFTESQLDRIYQYFCVSNAHVSQVEEAPSPVVTTEIFIREAKTQYPIAGAASCSSDVSAL